jgi:hypothetical protein
MIGDELVEMGGDGVRDTYEPNVVGLRRPSRLGAVPGGRKPCELLLPAGDAAREREVTWEGGGTRAVLERLRTGCGFGRSGVGELLCINGSGPSASESARTNVLGLSLRGLSSSTLSGLTIWLGPFGPRICTDGLFAWLSPAIVLPS